MNSIVSIINSAESVASDSPYDTELQGYGMQNESESQLLQTVMQTRTIESALQVVGDDMEAGLSSNVIAAMRGLKAARSPKFLVYRAAFKRANRDIRLGYLDSLIDEAAPDASHQTDASGIVENIIEIVKELGELFTDEDDIVHIRHLSDGHYEIRKLDSKDFEQWISYQYYKEYGRAPKKQQLQDAFSTLAGCAVHEGPTHPVYKRVAHDEHGYHLDMADTQWRAIRLSPAGYEIIEQPPVRFRRTTGSQALPIPEQGGSLDDLLALVNIKPKDDVMLVTVMCETLRPDTAYPVVEFGGGQGSGKSSNQHHIRQLLDPKNVALRSEPKSVHDIFIAAANNHIVSYNNLSYLSADYQDALCNLSTGGGYAGRKLYSDDEETTYEAKTPVFMNGISALATQPDLLSRVVYFLCPEITERLSDQKLAEIMSTHGPKALDYILTTFCKALALLPSIELDKPPRLMDFVRLGEAVARVMGYEAGHFARIYKAALNDAAEQSIEGVPVIETLLEYVKRRGSIETTVGKLFNDLKFEHERLPSAWPKTSKGFRDSLGRYESALRLMGVSISYLPKRRDGRPIRLTFLPQHFSSPESPSPPSPPSQKPMQCSGCDRRDGENEQVLCEGKKYNTPTSKNMLELEPPAYLNSGTQEVF